MLPKHPTCFSLSQYHHHIALIFNTAPQPHLDITQWLFFFQKIISFFFFLTSKALGFDVPNSSMSVFVLISLSLSKNKLTQRPKYQKKKRKSTD